MLSYLSSFSFILLQSARVHGTHDEQTNVNKWCSEEGNGHTHIFLPRKLLIIRRQCVRPNQMSCVAGASSDLYSVARKLRFESHVGKVEIAHF
jgi:hypothetical protein